MSDRSKSVFNRLMERGEEVFTQVSNELMMNPRFIQAMQSAMRGKETIDFAVTQALKTMNVPTRTEFKRATSRLEALESEIRDLRDELGRTRAQAERAARPAPRAAGARKKKKATAPAAANRKKATAAAKAPAKKKKKAAKKGAGTRARAAAPATPVIVGEGTPTE